MADTQWVENIKKIVLQAMEAGDPCDVISGRVIKEGPLEVKLGQKNILSENQMIVPEYLTDHKILMTIPGIGDGSVTVKNRLKTGQRVLLMQKRGAQQYLILGRW